MKSLTALLKDKATPQEVIRALLTAQCRSACSSAASGRSSSRPPRPMPMPAIARTTRLRVNGRDIRALVVGEGANLGVTQLGRVEYARSGGPERKGGRINTDAIDNSAGVDTSDHEVNIKILMSGPLRRGELKGPERDSMLAFMTEDVAALVLKDNYDQTLAISVAERTAAVRPRRRDAIHARAGTQRPARPRGRIASRRRGAEGARPRIAGPHAPGACGSARLREARPAGRPGRKRSASIIPISTACWCPISRKLAVENFEVEVEHHRLAREIVATQLVNRLVNFAGPLFVHRMRELSNAPQWCIARALRAGRRRLRIAGPRLADRRARSQSAGRDPESR